MGFEDYERTVLAGLLHDPTIAFRYFGRLTPALFSDVKHKALIQVLLRRKHATHSPEIFRDRLAGTPKLAPKARALLVALTDSLLEEKPAADKIEHALQQLVRQSVREQLLGSVLSAAHATEEWRLEDAVASLRDVVYSADVLTTSEHAQADMRAWALTAEEKYRLRAEEGDKERMSTGFKWLDAITGGARAGQLWVWGGMAKEGKTAWAKELAYSLLLQGKTIIWIAIDSMDVDEVTQLFAVRHSHNFIEGGVPALAAATGSLTPDEEAAYTKACHDLTTNPALGNLHVWKPDAHLTVEDTFPYVEAWGKQREVHAVIWDYIELMPSRYPREQYRLQVGLAFKAAAGFVKSFQHGKGVFGLTLHQMSRAGREKAEDTGRYSLQDYSEGAGVERAAHLLGWVLRTDDMAKDHEIKAGVAAQRSGPNKPRGVFLKEDFAHARIYESTDREPGSSPEGSELDEFDTVD